MPLHSIQFVVVNMPKCQHFNYSTSVVELTDFLTGPVEERFDAFLYEWIQEFPNMTKATLMKKPGMYLSFLNANMLTLSLLVRHNELIRNEDFKEKYKFIQVTVDNLQKSLHENKKDKSVLLKECQSAFKLLNTVCEGLPNIDPNVDIMHAESEHNPDS